MDIDFTLHSAPAGLAQRSPDPAPVPGGQSLRLRSHTGTEVAAAADVVVADVAAVVADVAGAGSPL